MGEIKKLGVDWSKHDVMVGERKMKFKVSPCSHGIVLRYTFERDLSQMMGKGVMVNIVMQGLPENGKIEEDFACLHVSRKWYDRFVGFDRRVEWQFKKLKRHVMTVAQSHVDAERLAAKLEA